MRDRYITNFIREDLDKKSGIHVIPAARFFMGLE